MLLTTFRARLLAAATAAGAGVALSVVAAGTSGAAVTAGAGAPGPVQLDRAFVIMLENHSQQSIIGDPNTPYLTQLATGYGQATSYYGVTHPSEPNYVALISGSNWWTNTDNPANRFDHTSLVDELTASHLSWGAYLQAMPATNPLIDYWPSSGTALYASKHNPFVLFDSVRSNPAELANVKPYTSLASDLNGPNPPRFVFIAPDQCNDLHGGVYSAVPGYPETPCPYSNANNDAADIHLKRNADAFVHDAVTTIMSSRAWTPHSAIFIVSDEGDYTGNSATGGWGSTAGCCDSPVLPAGDPDISASWPGGLYGGGLVPAIVIDPSGPHHFASSAPYNHYSLLRTLEDDWHLPELGFTSDHAQVGTMNEFLR